MKFAIKNRELDHFDRPCTDTSLYFHRITCDTLDHGCDYLWLKEITCLADLEKFISSFSHRAVIEFFDYDQDPLPYPVIILGSIVL